MSDFQANEEAYDDAGMGWHELMAEAARLAAEDDRRRYGPARAAWDWETEAALSAVINGVPVTLVAADRRTAEAAYNAAAEYARRLPDDLNAAMLRIHDSDEE